MEKGVFPSDPAEFNPPRLQKIGPINTRNGKIIKWIDPKTRKAKYEWDEDLQHGSHYHKLGEDGNTRVANENGETHLHAGDKF